MRLRNRFIALSKPSASMVSSAKAATMPLSRHLGAVGRLFGKNDRFAAAAAVVNATGLFDAPYYRSRYPDVIAEGIDPAIHYALHGAEEGRWPHPLFHGDFYLDAVPRLRDTGANPLLHFLAEGAAAGIKPNPLFDPRWYAERYMAGAPAGTNPLLHFMASRDNDPSPEFDVAWYRARHPQVGETAGDALVHYYVTGKANGYLRHRDDRIQLARQIEVIRHSGLFDAHFYQSECPDAASSGLDPIEHYVANGGYRRYRPHQLFDLPWYFAQCPEALHAGSNPLLHYLQEGAAADINPGPWFDTAWYRATYLPGDTTTNPLAHFLADGGRRTSPSPRFDAPWYLARYPTIAALGINPVIHYVTSGIREGLRIRGLPQEGSGAASAAMVCLKRTPRLGRRTALFITHAPNGRIKGHVGPYLQAFAKQGVDIVLVVAADRRKTAVPASLLELCNSAYVRENVGFDFNAWAHVLLEDDDLLDSETLYLVNDSLIGPLNDADFAAILARIDACEEDFVGLTDNVYYNHHIQSFFLALKKKCLSSYAFNQYIQDVRIWPDKNAVIMEYELTFASRMRAAGISTRSLFGAHKRFGEPGNDAGNNRTIFDWDTLLDQGFPFVKASLLGEHAGVGGEAVREAIAAGGIALARLDRTYAYDGPKIWADLTEREAIGRPPRVAFVAPTNYANGLGVAARSYASAIRRTPWEVNLHPMERPFHVHARVAANWQAATFSGRPDVALVHLNGEGWGVLMSERQRAVVESAAVKIGLFVWETSFVPTNWLGTIDGLDAIWAPTQFCADIFRTVTDIPVDVVPYVVANEPAETATASAKAGLRTAFSLDPGKRLILYAFDGSSFLARKNPHALIRAFRASGLADKGWQLVLKTKHVFDIPGEGKRLLDLVGKGRDVVVIDKPLSPTQLNALFDLCDVYASSHSSEGFGLTIAEAMEMGKVVVATDYGGSRDFLDASCGFPVKAEIVTLEESYGPYLRGAEWGQVDEADLARALTDAARAVADGSAAAIGAAARNRIRERLSIAAVAAAMDASVARLWPR